MKRFFSIGSLRSVSKKRSPSPRRRRLRLELLESRRVFTLPATLTTASDFQLVAFNGPTVDTGSAISTLTFAGDVASYFFAPQSSGNYTFQAHETSLAIDPEIAIYNASNGVRIAYNDDVSLFNDDARVITNLTVGVRYIVAVADKAATSTGNIEITTTAPTATSAFPVTLDSFGDGRILASVDSATDIDYFSFKSPPDSTGIVNFRSSSSTFTTRVTLFDSSGTRLADGLGAIGANNIAPNREYRIAVCSDNFASSGTTSIVVDFTNPGARVTNVSDSGPGSLRQAILDANAHPNVLDQPDVIRFSIPGPVPYTIALASPLPDITEGVDIDGGAPIVSSLVPWVVIDGAAISGPADGLRILGDGSVINRLNIRNFAGNGMFINADRTLITNNVIGTDVNGVTKFGNSGHGIVIQDGSNNQLKANLISGNGQNGIAVFGDTADGNRILDNKIGTNADGTAAIANSGNGILITDGDSNTVENNLLSGNGQSGVVLSGTATLNTLTGNKIGTRASGTAALPNQADGIVVQSLRNKIGGNTATLRNLISGNAKNGITVSSRGGSNTVIEGNYIGTDISGRLRIPNGVDGIRVFNSAKVRIGSSTDAAAGNVISGNGGSGVVFSAAGTSGGLVLGNRIGISADGLSALGNTDNGVLLVNGANDIQIGGNKANSRNIISSNGSSGVFISSDARRNQVSRNRIGINLSGGVRGNGVAGVTIQGSNNTIGGVNAAFANIIAGNVQGIALTGTAAKGNTISFNTIGSTTAPNTGRGIQITNGASANSIGPGNTIRRNETGILIDQTSFENRITENSISENLNLGIDLLGPRGATANDPGDADTGGNRLQNFPQFTSSPVLFGSDIEVSFTVNTLPTQAAYPLTIEFFVSDGGSEGAKFLGRVFFTETNFNGGSKTITLAGQGTGLTVGTSKIVATATDALGNTSEFSVQRSLVASTLPAIAPTLQSAAAAIWDSSLIDVLANDSSPQLKKICGSNNCCGSRGSEE